MLQLAVSPAPAVAVGSRIQAIDPDTGKQRLGTVLEVNAHGFARVCFDLKWMHDWLPVGALMPTQRKLTVVEVTHVGGKRSFMLWGNVREGWAWHMGHPQQREWAFPAKPHRLSLGTPVRTRSGISGVISGHSTADCNSYRISWFDRRLWCIRHKWMERGNFEVIATQQTAAAAR